MRNLLKLAALALCFFSLSPRPCAAADGASEKERLTGILEAVCAVQDCSKTLNPYNHEDAKEIMTNSAYIIYNTNYEELKKYNDSLKNKAPENSLLVPAKWVDSAVCRYYGFEPGKRPELRKAAEKLAPNGFYTVAISDPGAADYEIKQVETLKNGLLRASGENMDGSPFRAYFGKSNCGGKPHWVLLRAVDMTPAEEDEQFHPELD